MNSRRWLMGMALCSILLFNGCKHCCKKRDGCCPATNGPIGPAVPYQGGTTLPPQNIPIDPPPSRYSQSQNIPINPPPSRYSQSSPELLLPAPLPPSRSGYLPSSPRGYVILGEPEFSNPVGPVEEKKPAVKTPEPPLAADESPMSPLPVGIANFAQVKEGVSNGLRPDLEGLEWLQTKGYKTVLFLRSGKEDDSSDRKQIDKRALNYLTMTVTPETISPETVTEFNRIVNDANGRPLFVYDLDGAQAGAMWYLYFRTSELLSDDEARVRAGRFGLKEKGTAEQTRLWTAVQKYLADRNPK